MQESNSSALDSKLTVTNTEDTAAIISNEVSVEKKPRVNELDKFKRRLIRAIARLMLVEKKPEAEIWTELKKETTCDCKLLWMRMRALTIKKLKRLIAANDHNENITKIAQLSVTDWLLFDLVLVHEDVDVIGLDLPREKEGDLTILEDLYKLVIKYRIEYLSGDPLTLAWHDLTAEYNSRGRKCSPMLLQRRWYQLKKHIRQKFYRFWFTYRGVSKKLEEADKYKPTDLEMEIVKQFIFIVTDRFISWEQLIEEKKVSLFSDFERLQLLKKKNSSTENEPEIQLIEPHVETIDLGVESDEDLKGSNDSVNKNKDLSSNYCNNAEKCDENNTSTVIKTESVYDICDEDEVSALESMYIPLESNINAAVSDINKVLEETDIAHDKIQESNKAIECMADTDKLVDEVEDTRFDNDQNRMEESDHVDIEQDINFSERTDVVETQDVENNEFVMPKITSITSTAEITEIDVTDESHGEIDNIIERESAEISQNTPHNIDIDNNAPAHVIDSKSINVPEDNKEILIERKIENIPEFLNEEVRDDGLFIDGFELEDDGIEYIEDEEHMTHTERKIDLDEPTVTEDDDTPKIDIKLLLTPVVYTKKLDHMDVFRFIEFTKVKDKRVIENADFESKPEDKKCFKMNDICKENESDDNKSNNKPSECASDEEQKLVKSTSWLFRKPRVKTYNPIQLCKNPDFNTRLKRLTAGFFTSPRNRQLLKQCKPLTIDVHKSFEMKLTNDSVLLKKSYFSKAKETESEIKTVEKTVLPSELPGQSLDCIQDTIHLANISTSTINQANKLRDELNVTPEIYPIERNKVINLPDIDKIRRTNEKLLIAEVTPLLASNVTNKPPVTIVQENEIMKQDLQVDKDIKIEPVPNALNNETFITNINVEDTSETGNKDDDVTNIKEADIVPSNTNTKKLSYYQKRKLLGLPKKYLTKSAPKVRKVALSWNPKLMSTVENIEPDDDRLLARDTVERIIHICKGINFPVKKKSHYPNKNSRREQLASMKQTNFLKRHEIQTTDEKSVLEKTNEQQQQQVTDQLVINQSDNILDTEANNAISLNDQSNQTPENGRKMKKTVRKKRSTYCCWAREKLDYWNNKIKRVKMPHKCPHYKCICCCNLEYCSELRRRRDRKFQNVVSYLNLVSDDDSDHNIDNVSDSEKSLQISHQNQNDVQKLKQTPNKVDIGINTDFDKDFEESFAANINNLNDNILCQPVISSVTSLANEEISSNATQTLSYKDVEPGPQVSVLSTTEISNMQEKVKPFNINPIPSTQLEIVAKTRPKCKTKICSPTNFIQNYLLPLEKNILNTSNLESQNSNIADISPMENISSNNVLFLNKVNSKSSRKPVCLGKNKILLCSFNPLNKTSTVDVTHLVNNFKPQVANFSTIPDPSTLIPKGVHLVLLPNQELVLSLDSGVELDPLQINYLPDIMNSVQQQLVNLGIINNLPNTETPKITDVIQLSDDETDRAKADKSEDSLKLENVIESFQIEPEQPKRNLDEDIICYKIKKSDELNHTSEDRSSNELSSETTSVIASLSELDTNNKDTTEINEATVGSETDATKERVEQLNSTSNNEVKDNEVMDSSKSDQINKSDLKDATNISKKTILSDLMEMSGISLEDIANTETPIIQQPTSQSLMVTQEVNAERFNLPSEINGFKDNSLLSNPFIQTALNNKLKYADLKIIYSFEDLRYAYENNGQFYKMNTETGIIVPINVCIKKQIHPIKSNVRKIKNSVIDLTEEDKEDNETSIAEPTSEEINDASDIPQNNVKPIKLFKACHPSILKHSFKTLFKQPKGIRDPKIKVKKVVKLMKRKRKQNFNKISLNTEESEREKYTENEKTNTDSESDEEPLALKAKRIRIISGEPSENVEETESHIENCQETEMMQLNHEEINSETYSANVTIPPILSQNEQEVFKSNPDVPVFFQDNNNESSEEDCILGV
ncbi:unnamed protein product [Euphydryas editha]|uniref:Uncharacterized protein n=1 Tax=Euphydryas editha TaxID=104508 RepID=A0AAU9UI42_EUPED|nr:unnamed protein product [Euphydryas editha]